MTIFLVITDGIGAGEGKIVCLYEETAEVVFETLPRQITLGNDPLSVKGLPIRIRDARFHAPGIHLIQFHFNDLPIAECTIRLR